jgi:hypothetical protein
VTPQAQSQERLLKMEKFRLVFFTARHVIGVIVVLGIGLQALFLKETIFGLALLAIGLVYLGFAAVSGQKLYRQYRRRLATVERLREAA